MLQVSSLAKRYGANAILDDVSFTVNPGERLGLIGPNGCGKTTLLRLIAGCEPPDAGSVQAGPAGTRLGYLEQGLSFAPGETVGHALGVDVDGLAAAEERLAGLAARLATAAGSERHQLEEAYARALAGLEALARAQTPAHEAQAVLGGLGLATVPLDTPVATLSGGQKTRLGLARLLLARPHVLLLDEPTNHLDIDALEWLEGWLLGYRGAALIVSHDRAFLDRTVTGILELDPRTHAVRAYPGNYSAYVEAKQAELDEQWRAYADQNEEIAQLRQAARHLRGLARPRRGGKADGGDKFAKGFFANRSRYTVRRAKQIEARVERLLTEERVEKPKPTWQMKLEFAGDRSGRDVLALEGLAVGYGGRPLIRGIQQQLRLGERVALVGANGSGKTTLLRTIAGALPPIAGRVRLGAGVRLGYYSQEQEGLDPASTPYSTIARLTGLPETEVRSFLHYYLFAGDAVFTPVASLSYGERARLALARLVAEGCNCLLLDEPVNHLDIPSRASFERALAHFPGTVIAAVHDRYFIRQFAGKVWAVEGDALRSYVDLEAWEAERGRKA